MPAMVLAKEGVNVLPFNKGDMTANACDGIGKEYYKGVAELDNKKEYDDLKNVNRFFT